MIDFLFSLDKALKAESNMKISCKKTREGLTVTVKDFKNRAISGAKIFVNNGFLGKTDIKGILIITAKHLPKRILVRAELGIYFSKKEFVL